MFCPNCGANNTTEQKFCRSCGLNLEKTAESLLMQIPSAQSAKLTKQERLLETFGNIAFTGFAGVVLIAVIGLIAALVTYAMKREGTERLIGILLILFIVFAMLLLTYVVLNEIIKSKKGRLLDDNSDQLKGAETAKLLEEKPFAPISSIVEETTNKLHVEQKTKKFE